ncbi:hypothetical protein EWM64_g7079 [Hericium alpestre]|uniref:Uncharacterized protein n=1 Tax=Hericium alpestre TaxID=135208 RepID=A0A4Y9ZRN8_9AGAM|nr:hypothetical protein EWM64_g7079 [Hericium alpestre]
MCANSLRGRPALYAKKDKLTLPKSKVEIVTDPWMCCLQAPLAHLGCAQVPNTRPAPQALIPPPSRPTSTVRVLSHATLLSAHNPSTPPPAADADAIMPLLLHLINVPMPPIQ